MAWGVVQDDGTAFPPGTVRLGGNEQDQGSPKTGDSGLKMKGNIVLQPQPSNSPNDPLNWSQSFKIAHILVLIAFSGALNAISVMFVPGLTDLAQGYNVSPDLVSSLTVGSFTFWSSAASFITVSGASIWGRRPFYIISAFIVVVSNAVSSVFKNFTVLVATRIVTGLASAPLLTLITSSISDIFFVHERGIFIAVWNASLNASAQLGSVIGGFIIDGLGIQATFSMAAIVGGSLLPLAYFLVIESLYTRPADPAAASAVSPDRDWSGGGYPHDEYEEDLKGGQSEPREPFGRRLRLFRGRMTGSSFWKGAIKPLGLIAFPAAFYTTLLFSINFIFIAVLPILTSFVFAEAPYRLSPSQIGLTNLPIAGVALIAGPLIGWLSDAAAGFMARHNGSQPGVFEPEFRLVALIVAAPITATGLVAFGQAIDQTRPLPSLLVWMCVVNFGAMLSTQTALTYIVDCFPTHSSQVFSAINLLTAIAIFVASGVLVNWFQSLGPLLLFNGLAAASVIIIVLAIPVYVFGKRLRGKMSRVQWARNLLE